MSPVNRDGSVSEISPRHSFLCKNIDVFIWEAGLTRLPRSRFLRPRWKPDETLALVYEILHERRKQVSGRALITSWIQNSPFNCENFTCQHNLRCFFKPLRWGHPNKMFRFPSPSLSWTWVGRSGKKTKRKGTHEGFWVPVKAWLLSAKSWLRVPLVRNQMVQQEQDYQMSKKATKTKNLW